MRECVERVGESVGERMCHSVPHIHSLLHKEGGYMVRGY